MKKGCGTEDQMSALISITEANHGTLIDKELRMDKEGMGADHANLDKGSSNARSGELASKVGFASGYSGSIACGANIAVALARSSTICIGRHCFCCLPCWLVERLGFGRNASCGYAAGWGFASTTILPFGK